MSVYLVGNCIDYSGDNFYHFTSRAGQSMLPAALPLLVAGAHEICIAGLRHYANYFCSNPA